MTNRLFRSVETAANVTDTILVSFSGGKDSVVVLDLATRYFKNVQAFFMYQVLGLSFQESILKYYEDKYGIPIYRIPHFELAQWLRYGVLRMYDFSVPIVSVLETYNYVREKSNIWWIAAGERISDSVWRRAMIKSSGTIDKKRGRFFPIAEWNKGDILAYIKQRKLKVGLESSKLGFSFRSLQGRDLCLIQKYFPKDFERIKRWFPLAEASMMYYKMQGAKNGTE